ncbi:hypothetical protein GQR58_011471 [Nymphon striatum]|nr:hypothetical protein GQR58_011471 [Nymphon striatum]
MSRPNSIFHTLSSGKSCRHICTLLASISMTKPLLGHPGHPISFDASSATLPSTSKATPIPNELASVHTVTVLRNVDLQVCGLKIHDLKLAPQLPPFPNLLATHCDHIASMAFDKVVQLTVIHDWPHLVLRWLEDGQQGNDAFDRPAPFFQPTLRNPTLDFRVVTLAHMRRLSTFVLTNPSLQGFGQLPRPPPTNDPPAIGKICHEVRVVDSQWRRSALRTRHGFPRYTTRQCSLDMPIARHSAA